MIQSALARARWEPGYGEATYQFELYWDFPCMKGRSSC